MSRYENHNNTTSYILNVLISIFLITITSPLFIAIVIINYFSQRGDVFFVQPRPGKNNKIFNLIKFKTMNDQVDQNGKLLPAAQRITLIGKILRKSSLDELPQLINVIKGDMSIVGPRPLRVEYLPQYNERQSKRHNVKPGITGWAQINGRNSLSWDERLELDVWYVENHTISLDIKIIFLTLLKVLKREGVEPEQDKTMEPFRGTKLDD